MSVIPGTNIPGPDFTATGFVSPTELSVLAGAQADLNAAFKTLAPLGLNFGSPDNPTPQGQLAASWTAVIGAALDAFCALANGVDPAYATGRLQDAIGRLYFIERKPDQSTVVQCVCIGLQGTTIPVNARARDTAGNVYAAVSGGVIPASGNITLAFANQVTGPIPCPAGTLNVIFQSVIGWDALSNPADGVLGTVVENPAAFEQRRQQSVEGNANSTNDAILGDILDLPGVLDAYVVDNSNNYPVAKTPQCVITGTIAGTALTVDSIVSGSIAVGQTVTGSDGSSVAVVDGTTISSGSGTSWVVNHSQTVTLTTMNLGGVTIPPNSLYVAAVGGDQTAIATAIWSKKSDGCPYYPGNTTVTIYDPNAQYAPPGVPYVVVYEIPPALPFCMVVNIQNDPSVPSNAATLIQNAVLAAFAGTDGGPRQKIGALVLASRFNRGINNLGAWAEIVSLFIGSPNAPTATVTATVGATFNGVATGANLVVTGISGLLSVGDTVLGAGVPAGTTILSQSSGSTGSNGTYVTSQSTTANGALSTTSTVLDVTAIATGVLAAGQFLFDAAGNILEGSMILSQISGSAGSTGTYRLSQASFTASESVNAVVPNLTRIQALITQAPSIVPLCIEVNLV